jgi:hypothetical protein
MSIIPYPLPGVGRVSIDDKPPFYDAGDRETHWVAWLCARREYRERLRVKYPAPDRFVVEQLQAQTGDGGLVLKRLIVLRQHFRENGWMAWC